MLFCAYYSESETPSEYSDHLSNLIKFEFEQQKHSQEITDRIIENCDRIRTYELKKVANLPEDNFASDFDSKIVDKFFDDLEHKVKMLKTHGGDYAEKLLVSLKVG